MIQRSESSPAVDMTEPPEEHPQWRHRALATTAASAVAALGLFAGCTPEEVYDVPLHAGRAAYNPEGAADAMRCIAEHEPTFSAAGMAAVTMALQDGMIVYENGDEVDCGPGGGLASDDVWNISPDGDPSPAATWIDDWALDYITRAYPATKIHDVDISSLEHGKWRDIIKPGRTIFLYNFDNETNPTEYDQIAMMVDIDEQGRPLVLDWSVGDTGKEPTPYESRRADYSGLRDEPLVVRYPDYTIDIVQLDTTATVSR